jgi:zinc protease
MNTIKKCIVAITVIFCLLTATQLLALIKSPPEKAILPNGLRVIVVEDRSLPLAAAGIIFDAQTNSQGNCNAGLGKIYRSLFENSGFSKQNRFDFNAELEKVGIITEFGGSQEVFYAACQGNADQLPKMFEALNKLGFSLKPTPEDFSRAKSEAIRLVKTTKKYPLSTGLMTREIWKDLFPSEGLACHGPIEEDKLNRMEFGNLKSFAEQIFVPNNAVLVVVGDVNASEVFRASMKSFGSHSAATKEAAISTQKDEPTSRKNETVEFFDIDDTQVLIGFEAPGFSSSDMAAVKLWETSLDGINSSWLETVVGKDFPELSDLHASYYPGKERGLFLIGFSSKDSDVNRPINFILSSLSNMFNDPPRGENLRRLIEMQQLRDLARRETRLERVYDLGFSEIMDSYRIADGMVAAYSRITSEEMKKAARKMFTSNRYAIRIAYPLKMQIAEARPVKMKTLDNGVKIMVHNFAGSEVVGLTILFGIDSCITDENEKRMARLVAEMIPVFINDKENRKLNRQLDSIGASLNAAYTNDFLLLSARVQKQNLGELVVLLKDLIKFPEYSERFFKKSKEKILKRIEDEKSSPISIINKQTLQVLYPGLNLFSSDITREQVEKISFKEIQEFYRSWAVGENIYISAVGNFDQDKTVKLLADAFKGIIPGSALKKAQCPAWVGEPLEKSVVEEIALPSSIENALISVSFRMKPFLIIDDKEGLRSNFGANLVINHVLFSSSNAILADELRKIDAYRGLISNYITSQTHAILIFVAEVPVDKVEEAKAVINRVLAKIPQVNISRDNIVAAGLNLRSLFNRMLEKSDAQANVLASFMYNGLKDDFLDEILGIYSSVSIDDVKKAARNNFKSHYMLIGKPRK